MRHACAAAVLAIVAALPFPARAMADNIFDTLIDEEHIPAARPPIEERVSASLHNYEFTGEDALRLSVWNSQTGVVVAVHFRVHRSRVSSQANAYRMAPTSDRAANVAEFEIGSGFLHNVTVFCSSGTPSHGQTFVKLQVIRGRGAAAIVLGTIVQGYVTANQDRAWPGSPLATSTEGDGFIRVVTGTNPAAGVISNEVVPTGARWQMLGYRLAITTSAAVATRRTGLSFEVAGAKYFRSPAPLTQTASTTIEYVWGQGAAFLSALHVDVSVALICNDVPILAGHGISTPTTGLQAGDDFTAPTMLVREWLEV
jgi:hypothetical protein